MFYMDDVTSIAVLVVVIFLSGATGAAIEHFFVTKSVMWHLVNQNKRLADIRDLNVRNFNRLLAHLMANKARTTRETGLIVTLQQIASLPTTHSGVAPKMAKQALKAFAEKTPAEKTVETKR